MWTRLAHAHRIVFRRSTTTHRCCQRAFLHTTTTPLVPLRTKSFNTAMSSATTTASSKSSNLPAQLTDMCMSHTHFQAFQGNPLNKLHLHRKDEQHIQSLQSHTTARFLVLNARLQPLLRTLPALPSPPHQSTPTPTPTPTATLATIETPLTTRSVITWLTAQQLSDVLPHNPIIALLGQVDNEAPIAATITTTHTLTQSGTHTHTTTPPNDGSLEEDVPYHAVLLQTEKQSNQLLTSLSSSGASSSGAEGSYGYHDLRMVLPALNYTDASILAQSRALLEWHNSSLYCGKCGTHTQSLEGGAKRQCTAPAQPTTKRTPTTPPTNTTTNTTTTTTATATTTATYCGRTLYPRTDSVTITLTISHDGQRALLGRKREFPAGVYTCLAGFLEGGETPEEGARREVWEESGVCVSAVRYFASQPWPFLGGQLMIGCYAQVDPHIMQNKTKPATDSTGTSADTATGTGTGAVQQSLSMTVEEAERIQLLDGELESVRWFTRAEVGEMLTRSRQRPDAWSRPDAFKAGELRVPPPYAIAHQLIAHWFMYGGDVMNQAEQGSGAAASEVEALMERGRRYGNLNLQGRFIAHL